MKNKKRLKICKFKFRVLSIVISVIMPLMSLVIPNTSILVNAASLNSQPLYNVSCGDGTSTSLGSGGSFGTLNSIGDQVYGVDSKTGQSWGYVDNPTWGHTFSGNRTSPYDSFRQDNTNDIISYRFQVPNDGSRFKITLGFKDESWTNNDRKEDIYINGNLAEAGLIVPTLVAKSKVYTNILGANGEIKLDFKKVQGSSQNALINWIKIEQIAANQLNSPKISKISYGDKSLSVNFETVENSASYNIYYGTSSGNYTNVVNTTNQGSYTITGLTNGTTYYVAVTAKGSNESLTSNEVIGVPSGGNSYVLYYVTAGNPSPDVLQSGENFGAANSTKDQVYGQDPKTTYNWGYLGDVSTWTHSENLGALGSFRQYNVDKTTGQGLTYKFDAINGNYKISLGFQDAWNNNRIEDILINGTKVDTLTTTTSPIIKVYSDVKVTNGQITININNAAGTPEKALVNMIKIEKTLDDALPTPTINKITSGDKSLTLDFTTVTGATSYNIKYGTTSGNYTTTINNVTGSPYTINGLVNDTPYYVTISAHSSGSADSNDSNEVRGTPVTTDSFVMYYVGAGAKNPSKLRSGEAFGIGNSLLDMPYGKDPSTLYSWGYIDDKTWSNDNGTDNYGSFRQDDVGEVGKGLTYKFEVPNGKFKISLGLNDPYNDTTRKEDIVINGTAELTDFVPTNTNNVKVYSGIDVSNGELNIGFIKSADNLNGGKPIINWIKVEKMSDDILPAPTLNKLISGDRSLTVDFTPVPGATSYNIKYSTGSNSEIKTINVKSSLYTITELTNDTNYYVVVSAVVGNEEKSIDSNGYTGTPSNPYSRPLYYVNCGDKLPNKLENGESFGIANSVMDQAYGKDLNTSYSWGYMTDRDTWAQETSDNPYDSYRSDNTKIQNPGEGLTYKFDAPNGLYRVTLGFKDPWNNSSRTQDLIINGVVKDKNYIPTGSETSKTYTDIKVIDGTLQISAVRSAGNTDPYASSMLSWIKIEMESIGSPTLNKVTVGDKSINVDFTPVEGATSYNIKYGTESGNYTNVIKNVTTSTYTITGLNNGTHYYVAVSAVGSRESIDSNEYTGTPVDLNSAVMYFVNCGDSSPDKLEPGESLGALNSLVDQAFGKDSKTSYSWGYTGSNGKTYAWQKSGANGIYDCYRQDEGVTPGQGLTYKFEVPNGSYKVTLGFYDPWNNQDRKEDIILNGEARDVRFVPGNTPVKKDYYGVIASNGSIEIDINRSSDNSSSYTSPIISTITITRDNTPKPIRALDKNIMYYVSCGNSNPATLKTGDKFGVRNGLLDQPYSKDPITGYSWGYLTDRNTWSQDVGGSRYDNYRSDSTAVQTPGSGLTYRFEVPNETYRVTLGFKDPWNNTSRTENVIINGETRDAYLVPGNTETNHDYFGVTVNNGVLDVSLVRSFGNIDKYSSPMISYIIVAIDHTLKPARQIDSNLLYSVICGDSKPTMLENDEKFGTMNGILDQPYSKDPFTGNTWGYSLDRKTWSQDLGDSKYNNIRVDNDTSTIGKGTTYQFQVKNGFYKVSLGFKDPWNNSLRLQDIYLNGVLRDSSFLPTSDETQRNYDCVEVKDGILKIEVLRSELNDRFYDAPMISWITIANSGKPVLSKFDIFCNQILTKGKQTYLGMSAQLSDGQLFDLSNAEITYSVSDPSILTIEKGKLNPMKTGEVKIYATAKVGDTVVKSNELTIKVTDVFTSEKVEVINNNNSLINLNMVIAAILFIPCAFILIRRKLRRLKTKENKEE